MASDDNLVEQVSGLRRFEAFDAVDFKLLKAPPDSPPFWTELAFSRCANCPLDEKLNAHCPAALQLASALEPLNALVSFDSAANAKSKWFSGESALNFTFAASSAGKKPSDNPTFDPRTPTDPDWQRLPATTPDSIRRLLRREQG